jgi:hypothetical protein
MTDKEGCGQQAQKVCAVEGEFFSPCPHLQRDPILEPWLSIHFTQTTISLGHRVETKQAGSNMRSGLSTGSNKEL